MSKVLPISAPTQQVITDEQIVLAYQLILGREPESELAIRGKRGQPTLQTMRAAMMSCTEFAGLIRTMAEQDPEFARRIGKTTTPPSPTIPTSPPTAPQLSAALP